MVLINKRLRKKLATKLAAVRPPFRAFVLTLFDVLGKLFGLYCNKRTFTVVFTL